MIKTVFTIRDLYCRWFRNLCETNGIKYEEHSSLIDSDFILTMTNDQAVKMDAYFKKYKLMIVREKYNFNLPKTGEGEEALAYLRDHPEIEVLEVKKKFFKMVVSFEAHPDKIKGINQILRSLTA